MNSRVLLVFAGVLLLSVTLEARRTSGQFWALGSSTYNVLTGQGKRSVSTEEAARVKREGSNRLMLSILANRFGGSKRSVRVEEASRVKREGSNRLMLSILANRFGGSKRSVRVEEASRVKRAVVLVDHHKRPYSSFNSFR